MKTKFNLSQFKRIEDIIFIDEPILSHLQLEDINYLLYLVDTTNNSDIFLLFEVDAIEIFRYITARESLKNIISNSKRLIIVIEQSFDGEIIENYFLSTKQLDPDYLPQDDSFISLQPTTNSYYYNMIAKYENQYYLESLRKTAFYLKFASTNKRHGETLGLKEIADNFLEKISKSFTNYVKIDFKRQFENHIFNKSNFNSTINRLISDLDFRMVDLKYGSFEIGLAVDDVMKNSIEDVKIKEWAKKVAYDYKEIVLDKNISKEETTEIINNFTAEERIKIFKPIIEIAENRNFELKIKGSEDEAYENVGLKDKRIAKEILSRQILPVEIKEQDFDLVQFTAIIDKNDKKKFVKIEDTLFNQVQEAFYTLKFNDFKKYNFIQIPKSIEINLVLEKIGNKIALKCNFDNKEFNVILTDDKIDEGIKKITENIYEYYVNK